MVSSTNAPSHAEGVPHIRNRSELPRDKNVVLFVYLPGCGVCKRMSPWVSGRNKELESMGKDCVFRQCNINDCNDDLIKEEHGFPVFFMFKKENYGVPNIKIIGGGTEEQINKWICRLYHEEGFCSDFEKIKQVPKRQSAIYNRNSINQPMIPVIPRSSLSTGGKSINQMCNSCMESTCNKLRNK